MGISFSGYLKQHIQFVHEGRRDHKCNECEMEFSSLPCLKRHILCVHEGKKDHKCNECEKVFSTAQSLKVHIECIHEGKKDHLCIDCEKKFSTSSDLKRHIKRVHEGRKDHKCGLCEKCFCEPFELKIHMKIHEKEDARKEELNNITKSCTFEFENSFPKRGIKEESSEKKFKNIGKIASYYIKHEIKVKEERNNSQSELEKLINTKTKIKNEETDVPIIKSDSANLMAKIKKVIKTEPFD